MQRRIIAAVAAVVLAGIGAVLLYTYVNSAEQRAMSSMTPTNVLVVTKAVPSGTLGSALAPYVAVKQVPEIAVVPGALTDLSQLNSSDGIAQLAAQSGLQVGEQVLPSRFAAAGTTSTGSVAVPADMQLLSIPIDSSAAVAGTVANGDKIGVFVTGADKDTNSTILAFRDVLVVKVDGGATTNSDGSQTAASGAMVLTLAMSPKDATRLVFAQSSGKLWLALEPKDGGSGTVVVKAVTK